MDAIQILDRELLDRAAITLERAFTPDPMFKWIFPDEAQRGSTKTVRVTVKDVKRKTLPPLDDAFAREAGDFDSLDALRAAVRTDLGEHLMERYNSAFPVIRNAAEQRLYLFYKLYRANVRMKVNAIRVQQTQDAAERAKRLELFAGYFKLYIGYWKALQASSL